MIERTFITPRQSAMPIEARAVLARPDGAGVEVWSSSQGPHKVRQLIAEILGLDPALVRVVTPDVGGGFGVKAHVYPEEIALAALAMRLGRPVKWIEDRAENLIASTHARAQDVRVRAAMSVEGDLLAMDVDMVCDQGAYGAYPHGVSLEAMTTSGMLPGPVPPAQLPGPGSHGGSPTSPPRAPTAESGFVPAAFIHERTIEVLGARGRPGPRRRAAAQPDRRRGVPLRLDHAPAVRQRRLSAGAEPRAGPDRVRRHRERQANGPERGAPDRPGPRLLRGADRDELEGLQDARDDRHRGASTPPT